MEPELGVGELSRRVGLPKSTVFRLLTTLEVQGFIGQNSETGLYHLGIEIIPLANSVVVYRDLRRIARPQLRQLVDTLEDTATLNVLVNKEILNLDQVEFRGRLVVRSGGTGKRLPFHATAAGKALVAFVPEDELDTLIAPPLPSLTPATITETDELRRQLTQARARGYSTTFEELEKGLHAVATPIRNHKGDVIASLSISGPSYRLTRGHIKKIAPIIIQTANHISREMGYTQDPDHLK